MYPLSQSPSNSRYNHWLLKMHRAMCTAIAILLAFGGGSCYAVTEESEATHLGTLIARTPAMAEAFPSDNSLAVAAQLVFTTQPTRDGASSRVNGGAAATAAVRALASKRPHPPRVALLLEGSTQAQPSLGPRAIDDFVFLAPQVELRRSLSGKFIRDSFGDDDSFDSSKFGDDQIGKLASSSDNGNKFDLAANALQSLRLLNAMEEESTVSRDKTNSADRNKINDNKDEPSGDKSSDDSESSNIINMATTSKSSLCVLWLHPDLEPRVAAEAAAAANAAIRLAPSPTAEAEGNMGACGQTLEPSMGSAADTGSSSTSSAITTGGLAWHLLQPGHLLVSTNVHHYIERKTLPLIYFHLAYFWFMNKTAVFVNLRHQIVWTD